MQNHVKNYLQSLNKTENDIFYCEVCNRNSAFSRIDIHHIVFKSNGGGDNLANTMFLCRKCHNRAHHKEKPYLDEITLKKHHIRFLTTFLKEREK